MIRPASRVLKSRDVPFIQMNESADHSLKILAQPNLFPSLPLEEVTASEEDISDALQVTDDLLIEWM